MTDIVSNATRSRMMRAIRGKDTLAERKVRSALHKAGFRFRLHVAGLPGRPDIVLPKHRVCVFVHGCFWHRHPGCSLAASPGTRSEFWQAKFDSNQARDQRNADQLTASGWRVFVIWECGVRYRLPELVEWFKGAINDETGAVRQWPGTPVSRRLAPDAAAAVARHVRPAI